MKELTLNGRTYLSTKRAAEITGYTTDYVGQLARQGKVDAQLVGRNWYISEEAIKKHKFGEASVVIKREEEEVSAPQLEVLVSATDDVLEVDEKEEVPVEENVAEEKVSSENSLTEMQSAWQEWYKAQRSVPTEEEEVFLSKNDIEEEKASEEVSVPITKMESPKITRINNDVSAPTEVVEVKHEEERAPMPSPVQVRDLPAKRSWTGTGLVAAALVAILFVGVITVSTTYVLTKNTDTPVAAAFQSLEDYLLGIKRIE
ncbi:MAG: hypothetical protein ACJKSS_01485 [Patescibacteria group bacterium UBA2103]